MKKNITTTAQFKCFAIFILIVLPVFLATAYFKKSSVIFFALNILIGLLSWTYVEYHLHRFWTHNKNADPARHAYQRHLHHHKHPTEIKVTSWQRILLFSASIILIIASALWNSYFTIATGVIIGFSYSFCSHWILHQSWSAKIFPHLHRFHIHHHCKYPDRCFGFSTIFWDLIFQTGPPKDAVITERIIQFYYGHHH
jgi:hypothetical protein